MFETFVKDLSIGKILAEFKKKIKINWAFVALDWAFTAVLSHGIMIPYPAGIYLLKVNNRNTRTRCEICSKLTIKTPERRH